MTVTQRTVLALGWVATILSLAGPSPAAQANDPAPERLPQAAWLVQEAAAALIHAAARDNLDPGLSTELPIVRVRSGLFVTLLWALDEGAEQAELARWLRAEQNNIPALTEADGNSAMAWPLNNYFRALVQFVERGSSEQLRNGLQHNLEMSNMGLPPEELAAAPIYLDAAEQALEEMRRRLVGRALLGDFLRDLPDEVSLDELCRRLMEIADRQPDVIQATINRFALQTFFSLALREPSPAAGHPNDLRPFGSQVREAARHFVDSLQQPAAARGEIPPLFRRLAAQRVDLTPLR